MSSATNSNTVKIQAGTDQTVSRHARALANNLYNHLGLQKAIRVCEDRQWYSVLSALEDMHRGKL